MGENQSVLEDAPRGAVFLRHTETGEIRAVATHGEFDELISKRRDDGVTPVWEQTGEHDVAAHGPVDERIASDGLPESLGEFEGVPDEVTHGAPPVPTDGEGKPLERSGFDVDSANKAELEAEAERRELEVAGTGADGNVTADDLRDALR